jgi:asparagine synthase (glutamine-hydrolysing)
MRETLHHRGPDQAGLYIAPGVGLGHRRLSIIDLRPEGRQPMANEDGSVMTVFNGEIYNFQSLRSELQLRGHRFRSNTDTEVIVHLYEEYGADCVGHLRGMFALAIWDERRRILLLARDRLGKKPLFYRFDGTRLLFGSEPKAILSYPGVSAEPDLEAINHYLGFGYVPSPFSAFKGIKKLAPANTLLFHDSKIQIQRYWRLAYGPKLAIDEQEACGELIRRLTEATRIRMISDVPLGAFLSGGIDSSAIVAVMAGLSSKPVKTFSIGFKEPDYDETAYARMVAQRFATDPRVHRRTRPRPGYPGKAGLALQRALC